MSLWSRIANVFRPNRMNREIDDELESHIEEAIEAGRTPEEARRAFGAMLRHREASRDAKLVTWLDSLRADSIFGWRQIRKHKITSAAAILSLALAMGACTAAFRLIDALLLRPLPIAHPDRLGMAAARYIEALFYQVQPTDLPIPFYPPLAILAAAFLAALPGVLHAVRIDPVTMLRTD